MPCRLQVRTVAAAVANDIEAAKALYASDDATWSAESLALYTQAVLQGAFVLAKAKGGPRSRATASRTSAAISSNCSVAPPARRSDDQPARHRKFFWYDVMTIDTKARPSFTAT